MIIPFDPNLFFRYVSVFEWSNAPGWGARFIENDVDKGNKFVTDLAHWEVGQELGGN